MNWKIEMNGTLLLSYIQTVICAVLAIVNPDALKLYIEALIYICALAGVRALAKGRKRGKSK